MFVFSDWLAVTDLRGSIRVGDVVNVGAREFRVHEVVGEGEALGVTLTSAGKVDAVVTVGVTALLAFGAKVWRSAACLPNAVGSVVRDESGRFYFRAFPDEVDSAESKLARQGKPVKEWASGNSDGRYSFYYTHELRWRTDLEIAFDAGSGP